MRVRTLAVSFGLVLLLLASATASAHQRTWRFEGTITQDLTSLQGFDVGDPYAFEIVFDTLAPGISNGSNTRYDTGIATFTSSANASDAVAQITISDAPNVLVVDIEAPDASLMSLELTNFPGEFRTASRVSIVLTEIGVGTEDLQDYLTPPLPGPPGIARLEIGFPGMGAIIGNITTIEASSPVPLSGGLNRLLVLAAAVGIGLLGLRRGIARSQPV